MKVYLKVKIKSLAAEARIIRHEESKYPRGQRNNPTCSGLYNHRVYQVRPEARSSLLAYGYLRGRDYKVMEFKCYEPPNWDQVLKIARRFGTVDADHFNAWCGLEERKQAA